MAEKRGLPLWGSHIKKKKKSLFFNATLKSRVGDWWVVHSKSINRICHQMRLPIYKENQVKFHQFCWSALNGPLNQLLLPPIHSSNHPSAHLKNKIFLLISNTIYFGFAIPETTFTTPNLYVYPSMLTL